MSAVDIGIYGITPAGIAVDSMGIVYVASGNGTCKILKIAPDGSLGYAGAATDNFDCGTPIFEDNCLYSYSFCWGGPGMAFDSSGKLLVVKQGSIGSTFDGVDDRLAGLAIDSSGNRYYSKPSYNIVYKKNPQGSVTIVAGLKVQDSYYHGYSGDNGPATAAKLNFPTGLALDGSGNLYIADTGNSCVRKISSSGIITTAAGQCGVILGWSGRGDNGPATKALLNTPSGIATDNKGNLYIADLNDNSVRKVDSSGNISTLVGAGTYSGYSGDNGPASKAQINGPTAVTVDSAGNVYIADVKNSAIRMIYAGPISGQSTAAATLKSFSLSCDKAAYYTNSWTCHTTALFSDGFTKTVPVTYKSSNPLVLSVDDSGNLSVNKISLLADTNVTITATATELNVSDSKVVTVSRYSRTSLPTPPSNVVVTVTPQFQNVAPATYVTTYYGTVVGSSSSPGCTGCLVNNTLSVSFTPGSLGSGTLKSYTANCFLKAKGESYLSWSNTGTSSPITMSTGVMDTSLGSSSSAFSCSVTATTTVGSSSTSRPSTTVSSDCLFDTAEKNYPQYFSPGPAKSQTLGEYYYRQYGSSTYLATSSKDNHVYFLTGGKLSDLGTTTQWYSWASCDQ